MCTRPYFNLALSIHIPPSSSVVAIASHVRKNPDLNFTDKQALSFERATTKGRDVHHWLSAAHGKSFEIFTSLNESMSRP